MGNGIATTDLTTEWEEEMFWKAAAAKEDDAVQVLPEPVSSPV